MSFYCQPLSQLCIIHFKYDRLSTWASALDVMSLGLINDINMSSNMVYDVTLLEYVYIICPCFIVLWNVASLAGACIQIGLDAPQPTEFEYSWRGIRTLALCAVSLILPILFPPQIPLTSPYLSQLCQSSPATWLSAYLMSVYSMLSVLAWLKARNPTPLSRGTDQYVCSITCSTSSDHAYSLQRVPPPAKAPGRMTSYHNLPTTKSKQVSTSDILLQVLYLIYIWSTLQQPTHEESMEVDPEEEKSENGSEESAAPASDLPPELLLQQTFTGFKAKVDLDEVSKEARENSHPLKAIDRTKWSLKAEVDLPDIPIWFDHQASLNWKQFNACFISESCGLI